MPPPNINYAMTAATRKPTKTGICIFTAKYVNKQPAEKIFPSPKMFILISESMK
jgi:hypothetical protein